MPIPTTLSKGKTSEGDVDTSQLSAYAVYNNLVPGVKAYQDTSQSTHASKRKKDKKRSKKAAEQLKKENGQPALTEKSLKTSKATAVSAAGLHPNEKRKENQNTQSQTKKLPKQTQNQNSITNYVPSGKIQRKDQEKISKASIADTKSNLTTSDESTEGKKKRKRNKKNKRMSEELGQSKEVSASGEPEESLSAPPNKLRKMNEKKGQNPNQPKLLPNPFARDTSATKSLAQQDQVAHSSKKKGKTVESKLTSKKQEILSVKTPKIKKGTPSRIVAIEEIEDDVEDISQSKKKITKSAKNAAVQPKKKDESDDDAAEGEPPNIFRIMAHKPIHDSVKHGESLFNWLVHPHNFNDFMSMHWEKAPLFIKRSEAFPTYYNWILSSVKLDDILRKNVLKYQENLDITTFKDGKRETISQDMQGRARAAAVWNLYSEGNSVRILNPQTYIKPLWRLNASLQELFGCFVGANVYLTPPDSQGFAPHYDDIEAFILQIEGKKRWKLYKPRNKDETLPRFSSPDFNEKIDNLGKPIMEVTLEEGDLLYFPRGMIHQASTVDGHHSMHITLSCYQQNTYADLMKQHFTKALEKLTSTDVSFRRGLPTDYLSFMGRAHADTLDKDTKAKRKAFKETMKQLIDKVMDEEADEAADEIGKKLIWDSLPPYLTKREKDVTIEEDGESLADGRVLNRVEIDPDVEIKLVRKNCIRLIHEENAVRLYFSIENSMVYHQEEPQFIEVPSELEVVVKHLIKTYPEYTRIEDLPIQNNDEMKIQIVTDLWERGILMTKMPLQPGETDDFEFDFENAFDGQSSDDAYDNFSDEGEGDEGDYVQFLSSDEDELSSEFGEDDDEDEEDDENDVFGNGIKVVGDDSDSENSSDLDGSMEYDMEGEEDSDDDDDVEAKEVSCNFEDEEGDDDSDVEISD